MQTLTTEGLRTVTEIANRNGFSVEAATTLLSALSAGSGAQAQFNHPDLGGMGQWSAGGMIMIGDMFNNGLKHRVDQLCRELAGVLRQAPFGSSQSQSQSRGGAASLFVEGSSPPRQWWPSELGSPASAGAQNDLRYAYFPTTRRLAILKDGNVRVYETGEHNISGFSQAQSGSQSLTFTSQLGLVRLDDLPLAASPRDKLSQAPAQTKAQSNFASEASAPTAPASPPRASEAGSQLTGDGVFAAIERLAELRQKNILSEEEFSAKKSELLSRL